MFKMSFSIMQISTSPSYYFSMDSFYKATIGFLVDFASIHFASRSKAPTAQYKFQ